MADRLYARDLKRGALALLDFKYKNSYALCNNLAYLEFNFSSEIRLKFNIRVL